MAVILSGTANTAVSLLFEELCLSKITVALHFRVNDTSMRMPFFCNGYIILSPTGISLGFLLCPHLGSWLFTEFRRKLCHNILNLAEWLKFEFGSYWLNQAFDLVAYCPVC